MSKGLSFAVVLVLAAIFLIGAAIYQETTGTEFLGAGNRKSDKLTCTDNDPGNDVHYRGSVIIRDSSTNKKWTFQDRCDDDILLQYDCGPKPNQVVGPSDYNCSLKGEICSSGKCTVPLGSR